MGKSALLQDIIGKMTIEEKVSQLTNSASAIKRFSIKKYDWWNEALHGVARAGTATVFPQAIGLAATFNEELIGEIASAISDEARAKYNDAQRKKDYSRYYGLTFWSPNINIFRDPRWGRGQETYGEDPYLTSRLGVAFIKNLQQKKNGRLKTAACAKHFVAHSGPESTRHGFDAKVSQKDLRETYFPAFEAAVREGEVESVMGAYNALNGVPCCCNEKILNDILRNEWGFEGHVVSDCGAIYDICKNHRYVPDLPSAAAIALKNGCDLNCGNVYEKLLDAYERDLISEEDLDRALLRTLGTREKLGMFDQQTEYDDISMSVVASKEHKELSLKAAMESLVLLKNDKVLPLKKKTVKKVAVIGPNADNKEVLLGNYYGFPTEYLTVFEGIKEYLGKDGDVKTALGSKHFEESKREYSKALSACQNADIVLICTGLTAEYEGEQGDANNPYAAGDRTTLELPEPQIRLIKSIYDINKNVVILNFSGSAFSFKSVESYARAIMQCWYPGEQGGRAIAKTLFGEYSPSGRLPVTFYKSVNDLPDFSDYSMKNRTYRYFTGMPEYTFGYGLSYTSFEISRQEIFFDEEKINVKITARNTGLSDGDVVLKLYRKLKENIPNQPIKSLIRFKKVKLLSGETQSVTFEIPATESFFINDDGKKTFVDLNGFDYFIEI